MRSAISACASASKTDGPQSPDLPRGVLETAGVDEVDVYCDLASGVRDDWPGLDSCRRAPRKGDVLVVLRLDRPGRNLARLVDTVQDLSARGVGLRVLAGDGTRRSSTRRSRPAVSCRAMAGAGPVCCAARGGVTRTPASAGMRRPA